MFAHQVIDDIRVAIKNAETVVATGNSPPGQSGYPMVIKRYLDLMKGCVPLIQTAQKFHMGEIDDLKKVFTKKDKGVQLFMDDGMTKFPYQVMWFDSLYSNVADKQLANKGYEAVTNSKEAALTVADKENKEFLLIPFSYIKEYKAWIAGFQMYKIKICDKQSAADPATVDNKPGPQSHPKGNISVITIKDLGRKAEGDVMREHALNMALVQASLRLLNCKNVTTEAIDPPEALNRKRRSAGKQELFKYHVLNVTTPSEKRPYHEKMDPASHNRVHLCRGHFKEYTSDHPLFGKYTGVYWWQPHARGKNTKGIVVKDYNAAAKMNGGGE